MSGVDPSQGDPGKRGDKGRRGPTGDKGDPGDRGDPGSRGQGIESEIHVLAEVVTDLNIGVHSLNDRLRLTKWALIVLALIVAGLIVLGWQVRIIQADLAAAQADLRVTSCDAASLWLSLLDLPQPEPDPPLTEQEQAQADATREEFRARYTDIYESLACASLER